MSEIIRGTIERTYHSSPKFSAGVLEADSGERVRFAGKFCANVGDVVGLNGHWKHDPKFGRQFAVDSLSYDLPDTSDGLVQYLAKHPAFTGIGESTARKIVTYAASSDNLDRLIRNDVHELHRALRIPRGILENLREAWLASAAENEVRSYLSGFGLSPHQTDTLLERFGNAIVGVLRADPYQLIQAVKGYGFKKVDKIARAMGTPKNHSGRIAAGITYCLQEEIGDGHTWTAGSALLDKANDLLILDSLDSRAVIETAAQKLLDDGQIVADGSAVTTPYFLEAERQIHATFIEHGAVAAPPLPSHIEAGDLNLDQRQAYLTALQQRISVITGGAGTGKAQPLDAKILTPGGWRLMGDIKRGDTVMGANGRPCRVLAVYPQGKREVFRVTMSDGAVTECCAEHLWMTRTQKDRDRSRCETVAPLHRIRDSLRHANGKRNHWIPLVAPIEFAGRELPLDPYLVGLLLGDGCFRVNHGCGFTNSEPVIVDAVRTLLPPSVELRACKSNPIDYRIRGRAGDGRNPVLETLRDLGLEGRGAADKFIPALYKFTTSAQRLALLQGLLDADGGNCGHAVEYCTVSRQLAEDVLFLVRSLGGTAAVAQRQTRYTYRGERRLGQVSYRIHLSLPGYITPFRLPRKANQYLPHTKYPPRRAIVDVQSAGVKETQCIAVDAPDHLYVTDDFIVTHNTYVVARLTDTFQQFGLRIALCAPTGKAAKRIEELLCQKGLELEAKTIHRLLEYDGSQFNRTSLSVAREQVDADGEATTEPGYDVVIVDEVSMVDVPLMAELLKRIDLTRTRLILVGDHNQLPPVGPGNVLRDIVEHRLVPTVVLTRVERQAGVLKSNSTAVLSGKVMPTAINDPGWNVIDVFQDPAQIQIHLRDLILTTLPQRLGLNPIRDVQIITPTHLGLLGTRAINQMMQRLHHGQVNGRFALGDKVIQTSNDYGLGVMNGTIGFITEVDAKGYGVEFDGEGYHFIEGDRLGNVHLAYALTAHKAQGSEFPCAIVLCHRSHYFADRNWLYTAVTRAAKYCVLVGDRWGLAHAATKNNVIHRRTFLGLWADAASPGSAPALEAVHA